MLEHYRKQAGWSVSQVAWLETELCPHPRLLPGAKRGPGGWPQDLSRGQTDVKDWHLSASVLRSPDYPQATWRPRQASLSRVGRGTPPAVPRPTRDGTPSEGEIPRPAGGGLTGRCWEGRRRVGVRPDARNVGQVGVSVREYREIEAGCALPGRSGAPSKQSAQGCTRREGFKNGRRGPRASKRRARWRARAPCRARTSGTPRWPCASRGHNPR
jgi:hypothetical protein